MKVLCVETGIIRAKKDAEYGANMQSKNDKILFSLIKKVSVISLF